MKNAARSIFLGLNAFQPTDFNPALLAGDSFWILGRNTFNFGAMSGFAISRITSDHSIFVQEMQISFPGGTLAL